MKEQMKRGDYELFQNPHRRVARQALLGEEWFSLVNACVDEAEKPGMEPWIYDEDRWPSGSAGGIATRNPACRRKYLTLRIDRRYEPRENVIALFRARAAGYDVASGSIRRRRRI